MINNIIPINGKITHFSTYNVKTESLDKKQMRAMHIKNRQQRVEFKNNINNKLRENIA